MVAYFGILMASVAAAPQDALNRWFRACAPLNSQQSHGSAAAVSWCSAQYPRELIFEQV